MISEDEKQVEVHREVSIWGGQRQADEDQADQAEHRGQLPDHPRDQHRAQEASQSGFQSGVKSE